MTYATRSALKAQGGKVNEALQVAQLLKDLGGYGLAAIIWQIYRHIYNKSEKERIRYRDMHEKVLLSLPKLTAALEGVKIEKSNSDNQTPIPPGPFGP